MIECIYHYSYSFADAIVPELVERIVGHPVASRNCYRGDQGGNKRRGLIERGVHRILRSLPSHSRDPAGDPHLLTLGSVFQFARPGDVVWGTGVNPYYQKPLPEGAQLDIRAVRGPLTRQYILEELQVTCPEVYGDPGLLVPKFFPELTKPSEPRHNHLVVAQHVDELYIRRYPERFREFNVLLCQRPDRMPWRAVVQEILASQFVIASSLHAIIIAEAYGIPARWWYNDLLPSFRSAGHFKYNDYYLSTGRRAGEYAYSIDEALERGGKEPIQRNPADELLEAFPRDYFPSC